MKSGGGALSTRRREGEKKDNSLCSNEGNYDRTCSVAVLTTKKRALRRIPLEKTVPGSTGSSIPAKD